MRIQSWSLCDCKQNLRSVYNLVVWSLGDCTRERTVSCLVVTCGRFIQQAPPLVRI